MNKKLSQLLIFLFVFLLLACSENSKNNLSVEKHPSILDDWNGMAIAYSGYREGQDPQKKIFPTKEQVKEDLLIIEKNWNLIRTYGADQHAEDVLQVIKENKINLKVMLGIWLDGEPEYIDDNLNQLKKGIELTNNYRDIVIAVNVGNESQVHWSDHHVPNEKLISYIEQVKEKVDVPVTTADTWDYWLELEKSSNLIEAVDFIAAHIYPIWGNVDIDRGMEVTIETYEKLTSQIPNKKIIITEAGWATYTVGELHVPQTGNEINQEIYFNDLMKWASENKVTVFWFDAFDEPWKGEGTEGYWGLFNEKRKAKKVMHEWYPELVTDEPTSPSYK